MYVKYNQSGLAKFNGSNGYTIHKCCCSNEWEVRRDGRCVKICDTKREAMAYCGR